MSYYQPDEVVAYPADDVSLFETVLNVEKAGYHVIEVLPILRCAIIRLTPEQLEAVTQAKNQQKRKKGRLHGRQDYTS